MKTIIAKTKASGHLSIVIRDKAGNVKYKEDKIPNMILNGMFRTNGGINMQSGTITFYTFTSSTPNFDDMNGTYQIAAGTATLTRASGTGVFAAGDVGKEVKFADGTRCHIITFGSTTSVTVSKTFAAGVAAQALRRYATNVSSTAGSSQSANSDSAPAPTENIGTGTWSRTWSVTFASATVGYSLNSIMAGNNARIVLGAPVAVAVDDQIQLTYTLEMTLTGRATRTIALSSIMPGWPYVYGGTGLNPITSIVGNGVTFDVTTSTANHFLAGDTVILANVVPKRFAISSASSVVGTLTINTAAAHGLIVGDTVVIELASVGGYNGTWTVATVPDADTITITGGSNPGAMGASGTIRLATPATYFNGTFTVASKPSANVVRITSNIQGPAVDASSTMSSTDSCDLTVSLSAMGTDVISQWAGSSAGTFRVLNETNAIATPAITDNYTATPTAAYSATYGTTSGGTNADYTNDWTATVNVAPWNAGTSETRCKQIITNKASGAANIPTYHLALHTAQPKEASFRLTMPRFRSQILRDLP
jgi:hypothetical protein